MIHSNGNNKKRLKHRLPDRLVPYRLCCKGLSKVHSHVPAQPAALQIFSYNWGAAGWGEWHMFIYVPERSFMYTLQYPVDFAKRLFFAKNASISSATGQ